jgi:hypothetical protein
VTVTSTIVVVVAVVVVAADAHLGSLTALGGLPVWRRPVATGARGNSSCCGSPRSYTSKDCQTKNRIDP